MRTAYLDFTSAFRYTQCVVTLRAGVVSVVLILKLSCLFNDKLFPRLNKLYEFCILPLSGTYIFRQCTIYNDNVRYHADIVNITHLNK